MLQLHTSNQCPFIHHAGMSAMVAPLSVRKTVQRQAHNCAHGSTIVDAPQPRGDLSEAANAHGLTPCRLTSSRRAADRCDQRPSRASLTDWFRLCRIRSASFPTGVKDVGSRVSTK